MSSGFHTSMDQDLRKARDAKFRSSETEALNWLYDTLSLPEAERSAYRSLNMVEILKDGLLLCRLGDLLQIEGSPTRKAKKSSMPFRQMENVMFFLQLCDKIGMAHDEIFQTIDLFEGKDPYQVVVTLMAFSRKANEMQPDRFPQIIGPRLSRTKTPAPKP